MRLPASNDGVLASSISFVLILSEEYSPLFW